MNKFLVFLTVVALVVCMAIPAFAAEADPLATISISNGFGYGHLDYIERVFLTIDFDGENNPVFAQYVDIPTSYGGSNIYYFDNLPYFVEVMYDEISVEIVLYTKEPDGMDVAPYGDGVAYIYVADPNAPTDPESAEGDFLVSIGQFFSWCIASLGAIFAVITSSPPLFITVIGFAVVGFGVGLLSRLKNL